LLKPLLIVAYKIYRYAFFSFSLGWLFNFPEAFVLDIFESVNQKKSLFVILILPKNSI